MVRPGLTRVHDSNLKPIQTKDLCLRVELSCNLVVKFLSRARHTKRVRDIFCGITFRAAGHERRPSWAARGVTLGEPWGTGVSSHRDHDGLCVCAASRVWSFCSRVLYVAESECSVFSPE